eukprot:49318-Rhodomonas_salina.1
MNSRDDLGRIRGCEKSRRESSCCSLVSLGLLFLSAGVHRQTTSGLALEAGVHGVDASIMRASWTFAGCTHPPSLRRAFKQKRWLRLRGGAENLTEHWVDEFDRLVREAQDCRVTRCCEQDMNRGRGWGRWALIAKLENDNNHGIDIRFADAILRMATAAVKHGGVDAKGELERAIALIESWNLQPQQSTYAAA